MKTKIIILVLMSIGIFLFSVYKVEYPYKEGVLYSQNQLSRYNEKQYENKNNNNLVNRNEAIKIATYILRDILDIDMTAGNPAMYVDIYRNVEKEETYNWNIWWTRNDYSGSYGVEINSSTGEILNIYINDIMPVKNTNISTELTNEEILTIIKPLTDQLEINLDGYDLKISSRVDYNIKGVKTPYKYCLFKNKNKEEFSIMIDSRAEAISRYKKNPTEEV
ncbi:MAG: hypothetical protein RSG52_02475 [Terrisporobacter sp.]|uniref:hypothetical protein n=1 Tax=Terrisporobacter sp. TaxID=1965305 RepID=UPI002FC794F5